MTMDLVWMKHKVEYGIVTGDRSSSLENWIPQASRHIINTKLITDVQAK